MEFASIRSRISGHRACGHTLGVYFLHHCRVLHLIGSLSIHPHGQQHSTETSVIFVLSPTYMIPILHAAVDCAIVRSAEHETAACLGTA